MGNTYGQELVKCISYGDREVIYKKIDKCYKYYLDTGKNVFNDDSFGGLTPFGRACFSGMNDVAIKLIETGCI